MTRERSQTGAADVKETLTEAAIALGKARGGREDGTRGNKVHCFRRCLRDLLEKRLGLFQIRRVKTLGKPTINFAQQVLCEACASAQLE